MEIHCIDPTKDARWAPLIERHPKSSVFHTVGWLQALRRTYSYEPVVFTTSSPAGNLMNGMVFCRVNSWLTGCRLVSLPFSDHCEPLFDSREEFDFLIRFLHSTLERQGWKYLEIRSKNEDFAQSCNKRGFSLASTYFFHSLNLRPDLDQLFRGFDKDCVQRRISRAERAGLVEISGRSEKLLKDFYTLFMVTRARHRLPPSPYVWFQNLIKCQGDALEIRIAYKDTIPVSAILTLRFRETIYYKYGCSDAKFNCVGAMPWLLWKAIIAAKSDGAMDFDLGRTEEENPSLLAFKNRWVHRPQRLRYWRFPNVLSTDAGEHWKMKMARSAFSFMPNFLLRATGRLLYRHVG